MKQILLLGAGKSTWYLIDHLLRVKSELTFSLTICDLTIDNVPIDFPKEHYEFVSIDLNNPDEREQLIRGKFLVISMLPAFMHPLVAADCVKAGAHFASASYESDKMRELKSQIEERGLKFINECGLDPGMDHMSAMKIIHEVHAKGGEVESFRSYCGGLIAPESNDNPWGYKFSWNPRNVILAGQGTAKYLDGGKLKLLPYQRLFQHTERIVLDNGQVFEGYPNRDSVSYREVYGLHAIKTMIRGTLRMEGFCDAWHILVGLGLTDDSFTFSTQDKMTFRMLTESLLPECDGQVEQALCQLFNIEQNGTTFQKLKWAGIFDTILLKEGNYSPAKHLQDLLEPRWKLKADDRDLVVMQHIFDVNLAGKKSRITTDLYVEGASSRKTAMAKTVGLPLAYAVEMIIKNDISSPGLYLPIIPSIYEPILKRLEQNGIVFREH
ncbi:MAG: saccharopine dehydrogenase family protein [Flavobacteriales bacterium]